MCSDKEGFRTEHRNEEEAGNQTRIWMPPVCKWHVLANCPTQQVKPDHLQEKRGKQTNKQTNKQTSNQASNQASKQASKQTNKQTNNQANKQTNKQANKQTNKQTNKQVFGNILKNVIWQEGRPFLVSTCVIMCSRAFKKSSGRLPTSPRPSPFFKSKFPRFNFVIVQGGLANS